MGREELLMSAVSIWQQGLLKEAEASLRNLLIQHPGFAPAYLKLGELLESLGSLEQARDSAESAVRLEPDDFQAYFLIASILIRQNRFSEAVLRFNHGVQLSPAMADCVIQTLQGFQDETVRDSEGKLKANPAHVQSLITLARFRYMERRPQDSVELLERALQKQPKDPNTLYALAFSQLLLGQFAEGWKNYESRFNTGQSAFPQRSFVQSRWKGEDLAGKRIFIYEEQGIGDTFHFIRYASLVRELGGHVIVECRDSIKSLVRTHPAIQEVVAQGESLPHFDLQIPLLSLPSVFQTTLTTIPDRVPYLRVPDDVKIALPHTEANRRKVGLVWAGNPGLETDLARSIPLEKFAPLWKGTDIAFYSLQVGPASHQINSFSCRSQFSDLRTWLVDFGHTAAVIDQMDLVVSVDTAVAHLAGALGKSVWLLLPFAPEWRWLLEREDSPWYPTMRLFRQKKANDWNEVMCRVREALVAIKSDAAICDQKVE